MAFKSVNVAAHLTEFNSAVSSDFLELYRGAVDAKIRSANAEPKHRTFAPSQMRCDRISWFRLRGTQPDKVKSPDTTLDFIADVGTACHEIIQRTLISVLKDDPEAKWVTVSEWVNQNPEIFQDYKMNIKEKGYESLIDMASPYPVRFACDGIIYFQGKFRLLEIKTSEFSSWNDLMSPKLKHLDQIKTYSMLLHIPDVLFLYQDRQYGGLKCFEVNVPEKEHEDLRNRMDKVIELAEANIAPEGLPIGDPDCTPSMCPYYKKCKEWGGRNSFY